MRYHPWLGALLSLAACGGDPGGALDGTSDDALSVAGGPGVHSTTQGVPFHRSPLPSPVPWDGDKSLYVEIDPQLEHQVIDGFGGCFNEQGWVALSTLSGPARERVLRSLFAGSGSAFTMGRVPIGASDFALDYYSDDDHDGDYAQNDFAIRRDQQHLIPFIQAAMRHQPRFKVWGSPWTPPAWMKRENTYRGFTHDGRPNHIQQDARTLDAYAHYLAKFVEAYHGEGVNLFAVAVQNEPMTITFFPSSPWSDRSDGLGAGPWLARFIGQHLAPRFRADHVPAEIWLGTINRYDWDGTIVPILEDPEAGPAVAAVGYQYGGRGMFPRTHTHYPAIKMYQTETGCFKGKDRWSDGESTWGSIKIDMNWGANGYFMWNMVGNQTHRSNWHQGQNSMITVDEHSHAVTYEPDYYAITHFSHFIKPGAHRIESVGSWADQVAFKNPDGELVIELKNGAGRALSASIKIGDKMIKPLLPAHSFNTIVIPPSGL